MTLAASDRSNPKEGRDNVRYCKREGEGAGDKYVVAVIQRAETDGWAYIRADSKKLGSE